MNEGYGSVFGFAADNHWASADIGVLHIWQGYSLLESYDVPGFIKGNLLFQDGGIYIGPFFIDIHTKEKKYLSEITAQFGSDTKVHYSQYKMDEVLHAPANDFSLVSISYQPPKGLKGSGVFSGPTNRLLLFRRSDEVLLKVIAENFDRVTYTNLRMQDDCIVFVVDGYHTRVLFTDRDQQPAAIPGFVAWGFTDRSSLIGSGVQRLLQYDVASSNLRWQSAEVFDFVNAIVVKDENCFLAAVNDRYLQVWQNEAGGFARQSTTNLNDTIEGIAVSPSGGYFIALSGTENYIKILAPGD